MSAKFKVIHLSLETSVVLKCPVSDDKHPRIASFIHPHFCPLHRHEPGIVY